MNATYTTSTIFVVRGTTVCGIIWLVSVKSCKTGRKWKLSSQWNVIEMLVVVVTATRKQILLVPICTSTGNMSTCRCYCVWRPWCIIVDVNTMIVFYWIVEKWTFVWRTTTVTKYFLDQDTKSDIFDQSRQWTYGIVGCAWCRMCNVRQRLYFIESERNQL
jgi:hypothetical protein